MFGMSTFLFLQSSIELKDNYLLFCFLGFCNATLLGISDIAVDGLATDLCKQTNESAAHILNIGYTIGSSFLANLVFHSLNKYDLCSLSTYLKCIALFGIGLAVYLFVNFKEKESQPTKKLKGFKEVVKGIAKNDNLITLSLLLFFDRYSLH